MPNFYGFIESLVLKDLVPNEMFVIRGMLEKQQDIAHLFYFANLK